MKVQSSVKKATISVACGSAILTAVMIVVFALLRALDYTVLLGAALGYAAAVLNFFLMSLGVQKAAESIHGTPRSAAPVKEEREDDSHDDDEPVGASLTEEQQTEVKQAKRSMQLSYNARLMMQLVVLAVAAVAPVFNLIATAVPLLFPGPVVNVIGLLNKNKQ